jgi:hypothetical protein
VLLERSVWPEEASEPTADEGPESSVVAAHVSRHEPVLLVSHGGEGIGGSAGLVSALSVLRALPPWKPLSGIAL